MAPQTPLTPGLGFVDEDTPESPSSPTSPIDEETALLDKESPYAAATPRTPTPNSHGILNVRKSRRRAKTESQEIWEELEHDTLPPMSPFTARRVSMRSVSTPSSKRASRSDLPLTPGTDDIPTPDESTTLLARAGTGRIYRDYRRQRSMPTFEARERRRRSTSGQDALGGWWKMKWWKDRRKGKGKEREDSGNGRPSSGNA